MTRICVYCKRRWDTSVNHVVSDNGYECPYCEAKRRKEEQKIDVRMILIQKGIIKT